MKKILKQVVLCACFCAGCWTWGVVADRQKLNEELIRLHVVANSDSAEDQAVKLQVRDAVLASLEEGLQDMTDPQAAYDYVARMLPRVEEAAKTCMSVAPSVPAPCPAQPVSRLTVRQRASRAARSFLFICASFIWSCGQLHLQRGWFAPPLQGNMD